MKVEITTYFSIVVQIIALFVGIHGFFIELEDKHKILYDILAIETIVQFVELFVYIFFLRTMIKTSLDKMVTIRYYDWFITTPIMLITLITFLKYKETIINNEKPIIFKEFIIENYNNIILIILLNFFMLLFGYLGEIKIINNSFAVFIGFIFLAITFYIIYKEYALSSKELTVFYVFAFIWSIYGIAAMMGTVSKNNIINILDLFAKNFFGFYIYYVIRSQSSIL
uniref:Uncharacterized protein n=1 Tax=viral metagenome TaxID=1070528 RepID=A0A6C0J5N5_9ZZZZ